MAVDRFFLLRAAAFAAFVLFTPALPAGAFDWPQGRRAAVSFTFDDARSSQLDGAVTELARRNVRATFYVPPDAVDRSLQGWTEVVAAGHEIGNETVSRPCAGLEDFTLDRMEGEITEANRRLEERLGARPVSFAYPCGETTLGRGADARSDVPLVAETFLSGRRLGSDTPNDPALVDLSQVRAVSLDGRKIGDVAPLLDEAARTGGWIVFVSHDVGKSGPSSTDLSVLKKLLDEATDPSRGFWAAPVGTVARHIAAERAVAAARPR